MNSGLHTSLNLKSSLCDVSSHHGQLSQTELGSGKWTCVFNNANAMVETVKVLPWRVSIPNVFTNINQYNSEVSVVTTSATLVTYRFPEKFYATSEYVDAFNASPIGAYVQLSFSDVDGLITITTTTDAAFLQPEPLYLCGSLDFFELLGWQDPAFRNNSEWCISLPAAQNQDVAPNLPNTIVNFSGTSVVHVLCSRGARGNMEVADSSQRDVLCTLVFDSNAPFGAYQTHTATDVYTDDIDSNSTMKFSDCVFEVVDHRFRNLKIPSNYHVYLYLKLFHPVR